MFIKTIIANAKNNVVRILLFVNIIFYHSTIFRLDKTESADNKPIVVIERKYIKSFESITPREIDS